MSADVLLSRLEKVKPTGKGNWIACCPAHADRNPSMTIAETDDGRVLLHCFGGCSVEEILSAVGLEFDALFPPKPLRNEPYRASSRPFLPTGVLEVLAFEALLVATAARQIANGEKLDENDYQRLITAAERLQGAVIHVRT